MNKTIFEQNWAAIRGQINARWSLMVEYDLDKVDKSEGKFDKFVRMLQVKYGYPPQRAKDEIGELWAKFQADHRIKDSGQKEPYNWTQQ